MQLHRPLQPAHPRRRVVAAAAVLAAAAFAASHAGASAESTPGRICTVSAAADSMPLGAALVTAVRSNGNELELLHTIVCDGRPVAWKRLSATDVLAL